MSNSLLLGFSGKKLISAPKSKIILFQISIYWLWRRYAYWPSIYLYNIWYCSKWNRTGRFDWPAQTAWSWNLDGRRPFAEPCYWYWANWRRIYSGFVWLDRLWPYNMGHILWAMNFSNHEREWVYILVRKSLWILLENVGRLGQAGFKKNYRTFLPDIKLILMSYKNLQSNI